MDSRAASISVLSVAFCAVRENLSTVMAVNANTGWSRQSTEHEGQLGVRKIDWIHSRSSNEIFNAADENDFVISNPELPRL